MNTASPARSQPFNHSPFWPCLEALPGGIALPCVWRARLGEMFERVQALFLQVSPNPAQLLPCPRGCGLAHDIVRRPDGLLVATCRGDPNRPQEIPLTAADVTPLEVSWSRLGRVLCHTLGLQSRLRTLAAPNTVQFGAWSAEAVPAILTIQFCPLGFRRVVSELVAELQKPFLLFAPTSHHFDAPCQKYLTSVRAGFFPLDATVWLDEEGGLRSARPPGEIFAPFTPQPKEADQEVASKAMAIVRTLDVGAPPTPVTVFHWYCGEGLSIPQVARKLGVSTATIWRRLHIIRAKTGIDPKDFRRS
jgi:hypothetical protein